MATTSEFTKLRPDQNVRIVYTDRKGKNTVYTGKIIKFDLHHKLPRMHVQTSAGTVWFMEGPQIKIEVIDLDPRAQEAIARAEKKGEEMKALQMAKRVERAGEYRVRQQVWAFNAQLGRWYPTHIVRINPNGKIVVLSAKMMTSVALIPGLTDDDKVWAQAILNRTHLVALDPRNVRAEKPLW